MNCHQKNIAALLKNQTDRRLSREERRRKARKLRILLTYLCFLSLTALLLFRLIVPVTADTAGRETPPEATETAITDGRLPGDDVPATTVCYLDPEEAENELIEAALLAKAHKLERVTVTHYCTCERCCGWSTGIAASGRMATPGVSIGVDPSVIPLGADVLIDYGDGELHYMRADDTGNCVKGNHIDVCVDSHEEAVQAGVKTATVWWCE